MAELAVELPQVYLQPGEFHVAHKPAILRTVLGSCVGVTFWSHRLGIGALCHGVLPKSPAKTTGAEGYRYVDFAICDLVRTFEGYGAIRQELQIKVFGGADVLPVVSARATKETVGHQNWHMAMDVLRQQGISVLAFDVGGPLGRAIQFHTGTGEVLLRRLNQAEGLELTGSGA
jgi:chemotaxis protein CheD